MVPTLGVDFKVGLSRPLCGLPVGELHTAYLLRVLGLQIKDVRVGDKLYRLNIFDTVSRQSVI